MKRYPFNPRARILVLLGDELIKDASLAVFELVKNSYDADSPYVSITMNNVESKSKGQIIVEDCGEGMDLKTITSVWLEPGTSNRAEQRAENRHSPLYGRLPLGEKGLGRFAVHKLGTKIQLTTRSRNQKEIAVTVDWERDILRKEYLRDVRISIDERTTPSHFKGKLTGTRIEITGLREVWTRGMVRKLARSVRSISSPLLYEQDFQELVESFEDTELVEKFLPRKVSDDDKSMALNNEFDIDLDVPTNPEWLEGLVDVDSIKEFALFRGLCHISSNQLSYVYEFKPFHRMRSKVGSRQSYKVLPLMKPRISGSKWMPLDLDKEDLPGAEIRCAFYVFDLDPLALELASAPDKKGLKEYLKANGGVKVYRDGVRVYDYGEEENDWLNLDYDRFNAPAKKVSNNQLVGAVMLDMESSAALREKTNREGFIENSAYRAFRDSIRYALSQIVLERNEDKRRIRKAYFKETSREPVLEDLSELRRIAERKKISNELDPIINRIEKDYRSIRETFLTSASAGLNLSIVIHEIEKSVSRLKKAVKSKDTTEFIRSEVLGISELIDGFSSLLRGSNSRRERASELIRKSLFNLNIRFRAHNIEVISKADQHDFSTVCSPKMIISTIMNLLDNSIWWLDAKYGEQAGKKKLWVGTTNDMSHPAIFVADNGSGFADPSEFVIQPFFSRKPDGMGLGLYLANEVMKTHGGTLEFPEKGDLALPRSANGAIVALLFGGK